MDFHTLLQAGNDHWVATKNAMLGSLAGTISARGGESVRASDLTGFQALAPKKMGMSENGLYPQWNSHLIGIMISKTIGFRGTLFSDTPKWAPCWVQKISDVYPLVNIPKTMENQHHFSNGKIHYNWPFTIAMLNYQRVIFGRGMATDAFASLLNCFGISATYPHNIHFFFQIFSTFETLNYEI